MNTSVPEDTVCIQVTQRFFDMARFIRLDVEISCCVRAIKPHVKNNPVLIVFVTGARLICFLDSKLLLPPPPMVFPLVPTEGTLTPNKIPPTPYFRKIIQTRIHFTGLVRIKLQNH